MRQIKAIVLHCSDSPDDRDLGVHEIRQWHKERGFNDVGYHYVIRRDGRIEKGRDESVAGAHVKGHNAFTIGVCWVGRNKPSEPQYKAILFILRELKHKYNLSHENVLGHYELDNGKTCPNLNMDLIRAEVLFNI